MSNSYFKFKQFTIWQDKCAMKVGTDGVLLGAWTNVENVSSILDVGTGTGLVALMLAQRADAKITAIEIDPAATQQAKENIAQSPWSDRIEVIQSDFRNFQPECKFDVIVSNPPYFENSLLSPDDQRSKARHTTELTYADLLKGVSLLLSPTGRFTLIVPMGAGEVVISKAVECGLFPTRQLMVVTAPGKQPKRILFEFGFVKKECDVSHLLIEESRHVYSKDFMTLVKGYYLEEYIK